MRKKTFVLCCCVVTLLSVLHVRSIKEPNQPCLLLDNVEALAQSEFGGKICYGHGSLSCTANIKVALIYSY